MKLALSICLCAIVSLMEISDGLVINGSQTHAKIVKYKVTTLCEYFQRIETLLTKAEESGEPNHVAWIYGYFAAILSSENDKVKQIIEAYMTKEITAEDSNSIFTCLQEFTNKLSLNKYISDNTHFNPDFKKQYLGITEDIRSIMQGGLASTFYMYNRNDSTNIRYRFIQLYKLRLILSDPFNKIFSLLTANNCPLDRCFLREVFIWSKCDSSFKDFSETLQFLNSMQRYLMSSLFVEDLYLVLNYDEIKRDGQTQNYETQLALHRKQYEKVSYDVTDRLGICYQSMDKKKQSDYYSLFYRKTSTRNSLSSFLHLLVLLIICLKTS